ncbi:CgeB family protein [Testudinibacter sp. P80/BLE/0925]|uniref:CgeB family protein n=1 Tax=Testudinibacter sp. TW-1 TaxID=3417757 RepID=UPI003D3640A6
MKKNFKDLKNRLLQEGVVLSDTQWEKIAHEFEEPSISQQEQKIQQLQDELYHLRIEKSKYQLLLTQRFQDRNNQTIAYQFGRLILDFFKNPIRNFITPNALLSIYAQFLKRKEKKKTLTSFEKKCLQWFSPKQSVRADDTFEQLVNQKPTVAGLSVAPSETKLLKQRSPLKLNFAHKKAEDLKVAVILDEFSFNSFKDEFTPLIITPSNWKAVFAQQKPDLFFCESAWSGTDSVNRPWKGKIYASVNFQKENRTELLQILEYCNERGIPTVFWNKEDPTHYPDRVHDFVKTAQLFDFVFTTAEECVEKYKQEYGLEHVYALPFATNPKVFNPIDDAEVPRSENIIFAGSWYANHIERSKTMCQLFDNLVNNHYQLEFYNRYYGDSDPNHLIPEQYQKYEKPNIPNKDIGRVYKSSIFGLNLNTVVDSETMFARRVFELMSSNTLVLSNYSKGMDKMFGDNVVFLDTEPHRLQALNKDTIERIREENLNNVLANHTYQNRFETILKAVGVDYDEVPEKVTLVVKVDDTEQLQQEINIFYQKFNSAPYRLLLVLSTTFSDLDAAEIYSEYNQNKINVLAESYIRRYGNERSKYVETPYFVLADSLEKSALDKIEKALLHSSYLSDGYIALTEHEKQKYIFEPRMMMNNIFAPQNKFVEALASFKQLVEQPIYYISRQGD